MRTIFENQGNLVNSIVGLSLIIVISGVVSYLLFRVVRRKAPLIIFGISVIVLIAAYIFMLDIVSYFMIGIITADLILSLFVNLGDLRKFMSNPFQVTQAKTATYKVEKIFDREAMYKEIEKAVIQLSKTKTGAIMTFEKGNSLSDIIKNGVVIKAPVTAELLETIFYPGTRLHDGACVIHGNEIVAASVFFTPTTKAFAGKYGSRHRAAIGISEISDSVTVVVSEETGRISFAVNGTLETVDQANFLRVFDNLLNDTEK